MRYNLAVAYVLWLFSGCGALGFHRFYLGKVGTGFIWLFSGGLGMVGAIYDAVTLPRQVHKANVKAGVQAAIEYGEYAGRPIESYSMDAKPKTESAETIILKAAKRNGGFVTPGEVAIEGSLTIDQARKELDKLASTGNAEMRVRQSGVVVYYFPEFSREGRDDFAV